MRITKKVIVPNVPKEVIMRIIEFTSEALIDDAKRNFGESFKFKTHMNLQGDTLETYIQFFPYKYDFLWKINKAKLGYEIVLDARSPGKWRDSLFGMGEKLKGLADTQWSAIVNFFHGYLTALAAKGNVKNTRKKLKEK